MKLELILPPFLTAIQLKPSETDRALKTTVKEFEITCEHTDTKPHYLNWYRYIDGEKIEIPLSSWFEDSKADCTGECKTSAQILMRDITESHTGDYVCEVVYENDMSSPITKTQSVFVYEPLQFNIAPTLSTQYGLFNSTTQKLTCELTQVPDREKYNIEFIWFRHQNQRPAKAQIKNSNAKRKSDTKFEYRFKNPITTDDAGKYTCNVQYTFTNMKSKKTVTSVAYFPINYYVVPKPKIKTAPADLYFVKDQPVDFQMALCEVSLEPSSLASYNFDSALSKWSVTNSCGSMTPSYDVFNLNGNFSIDTGCSIDQLEGTYTCSFSNIDPIYKSISPAYKEVSKSAEIKVFDSPEVSFAINDQKAEIVDIKEGTSLVFKCEYDELKILNPIPVYTIKHSNPELVIESGVEYVASAKFDGDVTCVASSTYPHLQSPIETSVTKSLNVGFSPQLITRETIYIPTRPGPFTQTLCKFKAKPAYLSKLQLSTNNTSQNEVPVVDSEIIDIDSISRTYEIIPGIDQENWKDEVACEAENDVGYTSKKIVVKFAKKPEPVVGLENTKSGPKSVTVVFDEPEFTYLPVKRTNIAIQQGWNFEQAPGFKNITEVQDEYILENLNPSTNYTVWVQIVTEEEESEWAKYEFQTQEIRKLKFMILIL